MPFVPVPNTVGVEIRMLQDGQRIENTLYFSKSAGWASADALDLGSTLVDWWNTNIKPLVSSSVEMNEIVITDLSSATGFQVTSAPIATMVGARTDEPMSNGTSVAISFRTASRGRSFRGRNYIVGLTIDQVFANTVTQETLDDYVAAYGLLRSGVAGDTGSVWSVVSRFSGIDSAGDPIPRTTGLHTPILSELFTDNIIDFQRRRLPSRGK